MTSIQLGIFFDGCDLRTLLAKLDEQLLTDIGMSHLTATETHSDFYSVAIGEELLSVLKFDIKVVGVDTGRHSDLLNFNNLLVLPGFFFLFGLFEAEFAIVHDLANRRICSGSDLNKVQILLFSQLECFLRRHDSQLLTGTVYYSDFLVADLFIDLMVLFTDTKHLQIGLCVSAQKNACARHPRNNSKARPPCGRLVIDPLALAGGEVPQLLLHLPEYSITWFGCCQQ